MAGKNKKNKNKANQPQNSEVNQAQAEQQPSNVQQKGTQNNTQDIVDIQGQVKTEQTKIQIKQTTVTVITTTEVKVEQQVIQIVETPVKKDEENVSLQVNTEKQAQQQTTLEETQVVNQVQLEQPQQQTTQHQVLQQTVNQQAAQPLQQTKAQNQEANPVPLELPAIVASKVEEEHQIIPGTVVEGQFQEVSKEKKQCQVEKDISQFQEEKKVQQEQQQIEVDNSTQFQNIVEEQVKKELTQEKEVTKQQKVEIQFQQNGKILPQEQPISKISAQIQHSHIIQRKNLHEFTSNQVPQLHHQDVPLQLQTTEIPPTTLQQGLQQVAQGIHISPLQPVEIVSEVQDKYSTVAEPINQPVKMILLTENISGQENLVKLQIVSQAQGDNIQLTIDEKSAMTVISSSPEKHTENPSIIINSNEEHNDDTQFIVLESSINQPSTNPLDTIESTAIQVMTVTQTTQVQQIMQSMTTQDGAPLKVFVGTKQFANFPEQQVPSPAIINQSTLQQLRKKNQLEQLQKKKLQQQDQHDYWTKFYADKRKREEEERRHFEEEQKRLKEEEEKRRLIKDKETVEKMEKEVEKELKNIKQIKKDINDEKPFPVKLGISIAASVVLGGASWFGLHDKKITAIGTLACLALAFIAQK